MVVLHIICLVFFLQLELYVLNFSENVIILLLNCFNEFCQKYNIIIYKERNVENIIAEQWKLKKQIKETTFPNNKTVIK